MLFTCAESRSACFGPGGCREKSELPAGNGCSWWTCRLLLESTVLALPCTAPHALLPFSLGGPYTRCSGGYGSCRSHPVPAHAAQRFSQLVPPLLQGLYAKRKGLLFLPSFGLNPVSYSGGGGGVGGSAVVGGGMLGGG